MVNKKKYFIEPKLQLIDQKNFIMVDFPDSEVCISEGVLYWHGKVKPTSVSKEYYLKLEYRMGKYPKAWLIKEVLDEKSEAAEKVLDIAISN